MVQGLRSPLKRPHKRPCRLGQHGKERAAPTGPESNTIETDVCYDVASSSFSREGTRPSLSLERDRSPLGEQLSVELAPRQYVSPLSWGRCGRSLSNRKLRSILNVKLRC